jgi:hypothetical protein
MSRLRTAVFSLVCLLVSQATWAQTTAGIVGVVRDTTGAVLPGVTVAAASPALIEKIRTVVTDGQGRFNVVDLRPGTYDVTFTLAGFSTVRREGVELSAGFTPTVNAEMRVGAVTETITVTGATPVVDAQNVRTQQVLKYEVLEALPSGARDLTQLASLTLGMTASTQGRNDVGGALAETNTGLAIHGSRGDDGRVNFDGMNTNVFYGGGGGQQRVWHFNTISVQETVIDTGGNNAESETGGANLNQIPREGGNRFSLHGILAYSTKNWASGKVSDALIARGSSNNQKSMREVFDYGLGVGGPILRDRLWFYSSTRYWGGQNAAANNYFNKSPVFYRYEADLSRPAYTDSWRADSGARFTLQASQKHKITSTLEGQRGCSCWLGISLGEQASPESSTSYQYGSSAGGAGPGNWLSQTSWSYPATNRLLVQASAQFLFQTVHFTNGQFPGPTNIPIRELTTNYLWGGLEGGIQGGSYDDPHRGDNFTQRASISYVTGSHAFKTGFQTLQGKYDIVGKALPNSVNYVFQRGLPLQVVQFASPFANDVRVQSLGVFAQDQWTINRLTLNLGVRYDHFDALSKAIRLPAGRFIGERSYPEVRDIPNYHDITPRIGAAYDVFGNGRTAIKGSFGRYLMGGGGGDARDASPAVTVFASTTRQWTDNNGNFVPDCVLENLQQNGECGTVANLGFGGSAPTVTWGDAARTGWGVREFNYQTTLALQHELRPGFGVTVGYYRTDWRNQQAIVNNALSPSDFTSFCLTAPTDARLGGVSGGQVCGLSDVSQAKLGQRSAERVLVKDIAGRNGDPSEVYNGIDIAMNARFGKGGVLMGGVAVGRTSFDYCWQNDLPHVSQTTTPGFTAVTGAVVGYLPRTDGFCKIESAWWDGVGSQIKFQAVYPLPLDFVVSGTYKQLPGIPIPAIWNVPNVAVAPSLGRDLAACRGLTGAACTATTSVALLPTAFVQGNTTSVKLDERINQVDLRLTKIFRVGGLRLQGGVELYNVFNVRPAQGIVTTYGPAWQFPFAILGGRLFKFGAQIDL